MPDEIVEEIIRGRLDQHDWNFGFILDGFPRNSRQAAFFLESYDIDAVIQIDVDDHAWRYGEIVTVDDPWGYGNSLEWATSCPPPRHNFDSLPKIRSERPAFELHYPHMVKTLREEAHVGRHF